MEKLSVIVATINDAIATNLTISQIIHQLEQAGIEYEIIIVDNGSNDVEKRNLHHFMRYHIEFPISYFEYDIKGTIPPHSFGVEKATGKYITMPDPHVIFSNHYFEIMIKTLKDMKKSGVEVVFSPFSVGALAKKDQEYICSSFMIKPNPFAKPGRMGDSCKYGAPIMNVLSNTISSMVCEREWFLKIGNMFPDSFMRAGGWAAESLLVGITTWMFGKKCIVQPLAVIEHPAYKTIKNGLNTDMNLSMATGAYILGGQKYVDDMPSYYGEYLPGSLEELPVICKKDRDYVEKNAKISLDDLVENWEKIVNA